MNARATDKYDEKCGSTSGLHTAPTKRNSSPSSGAGLSLGRSACLICCANDAATAPCLEEKDLNSGASTFVSPLFS